VGNYSGEKYLVLDGPDFRRAVLDGEGEIRQDVFDLVWSRLRVLARCSPADKYTIVQGALITQAARASQALYYLCLVQRPKCLLLRATWYQSVCFPRVQGCRITQTRWWQSLETAPTTRLRYAWLMLALP
jgi:hypothetical protein